MNAPSTTLTVLPTPQAGPLPEPVPGANSSDSRSPASVSSAAAMARDSGDTPAAPEDQGDDSGNGLISSVRRKQTDVKRYLRALESRRRRLVTVTIVAAAVAHATDRAGRIGWEAAGRLARRDLRIVGAIVADPVRVCRSVLTDRSRRHPAARIEELRGTYRARPGNQGHS